MDNIEDEVNAYMDTLLNSEKETSVTSEMDAIDSNKEDDNEGENGGPEEGQKEPSLFEITDEEMGALDTDIPLEKYIVEKNYDDESDEKENGEVEGNDEEDKDEGEGEDSNDDDITRELFGENDEGDEEEGILDVNDPDLRSYATSSEGITVDDLSSKAGESDEDEYEGTSQKKSFDELNGRGKKKVFEPGKLNKNNMILFICAFLGLLLLGFWWATRDKTKKEKKEAYEDGININDYNPDFGDYQARAYKEEDISEEDRQAYDKIEEILYKGEKEEFKGEEKQGNSSYSQPVQSQTVQSVPSDDTYAQRVTSSIRKGINAADYGSYPYPVNDAGGYNPYAANIPSANASGGYFDQLGQITSSLAQSRGQNNSNVAGQSSALRYTDAGRYIRDKEGGDVSAIPPNSIYPGYIIPAVLVSGINTDYPGDITARVTSNVYDSRTGSVLLIPSGSILRGSYSSSSIGIARIQIAWQALIINRDGVDYFVNLGSMVGVDAKGYSGIGGSLNDHYFEYLKAAGLASLFTYINSNVYSVSKAQKNRVTAQMIDDSQEIGNKLADKLLDRALDIAPTVTVKGGTRINVDVNKILTLQPYERDIPKSRYKR